MITTVCFAKTYTLGSGKWTDQSIWNNDYAGTTVKSNDVVIITGQVTITAPIVVEGTLQVEKGAAMVGMKDLVITNTGKFVNNGNTVVKRIINEGNISNNLLLEAMEDIDNKGEIESNNNTVAGNNFNNYGGKATGDGGAYFANNNISTSPASSFGKNVDVFYGNQIENSNITGVNKQPFSLNATINNNSVVLNVTNKAKVDVSRFVIEKSSDGQNFSTIETIAGQSEGATSYTDTRLSNTLTYYRVTAINSNGGQTILPVAAVKAPLNSAYTMAAQ
jgi:hypothetical protein